MKRYSRRSLAEHSLGHLAGDPFRMRTSIEIAAHVRTNPAVVKRVLGRFREAGLLVSERGHSGGWRLAGPPETITLADIYEALGERLAPETEVVTPCCGVQRALESRIAAVLDDAERALEARFATMAIAQAREPLKQDSQVSAACRQRLVRNERTRPIWDIRDETVSLRIPGCTSIPRASDVALLTFELPHEAVSLHLCDLCKACGQHEGMDRAPAHPCALEGALGIAVSDPSPPCLAQRVAIRSGKTVRQSSVHGAQRVVGGLPVAIGAGRHRRLRGRVGTIDRLRLSRSGAGCAKDRRHHASHGRLSTCSAHSEAALGRNSPSGPHGRDSHVRASERR